MSKTETQITIFNKSYRIRCEKEEISVLEKASHYLQQHMEAVKEQGLSDTREITVLAALNICRERFVQEQSKNSDTIVVQKIKQLQADIHQVLQS